MNNLTLGFCAVLLLGGCGHLQQVVAPPPRAAPVFAEASPAQQLPYNWVVITRENFEERLRELQETDQDFVVFALTPEGYQALQMNQAEMRRYIEQQSVMVDGYREYIEEGASEERRHYFQIVTTP